MDYHDCSLFLCHFHFGWRPVEIYGDDSDLPNYGGPVIISGIHFVKDAPAQSAVIVKSATTPTESKIFQNKTAIPNQGNFETDALHTDKAGGTEGRFSQAPQGNIIYCNGKESLIWGGEEHRVNSFINYDPSGDFSYDYSEQVGNTEDDAQNVATLHGMAGGLDTNTKLLLHFDNDVVDASAGVHTVTNNNVTFSSASKIFGTHAAVLNGTDAYLTIPHHADFDFSGGSWTVDLRFLSPSSLAGSSVLFYKETAIESVSFTTGLNEISAGDTITGKVSAQTAIVDYVDVTSGTWAGGDAAGTIYVHTLSGAFQGEIIQVSSVDSATIGGDFSSHGENYIDCHINSFGAVVCRVYECYGAGNSVVLCSTPDSTIQVDTNYHVEFVENGDSWYIFVNGIQKAYRSNASRTKNYISLVYIGHVSTSPYLDGGLDEYRVSLVARHTSDFEIPTEAYSNTSHAVYLKIGSTRKLKGVKLYIHGVNSLSSAEAVAYYWNGSQYYIASNIVDGTRTGGITLSQTGTITFDSTVDQAKVKYSSGQVLYWYKLFFDQVSDGTSIEYCTVDAPFQEIQNIWSGNDSVAVSCKKWDGSAYQNYTVEVNDFYTASYADLSSLGTDHYLLLAFTKPQQALQIWFVAEKSNTDACLATISYGDGEGWTSTGTYTAWDGTNENDKSFNKTGVMSFTGLDKGVEFQQTLDGEGPFYYYKISFSAALSADVHIFYVAGIENPDKIIPHDFSFYFQNRTLLCLNAEVRISSEDYPDVYNGQDSTILSFGSDDKLIAATGVFNRLGSYVYDYAVLAKQSETWLLNGYAVSGDGQFTKKRLSGVIGCCAPLTMTVCEAGYTENEKVDINSIAVFWLFYSGPVAFIAGRVKLLKGIEPYFDKTDSRCVNYEYIDSSFGFYDSLNKEYNLLIPSGVGQTTCNAWLLYDIIRNKWTKKVTTNYPTCGFSVKETTGAQHIYLGFSDGYMRHNENTNAFDSTAVTQSVTFSDMLLTDSIWDDIRLDYLKLICKAKNTGIEVSVSIFHRADGDENWTQMISAPMHDSGKRLVKYLQRLNKIGIGHELKIETTTSDKANGFEPLGLGLLYHTERLDTTLGMGK